MTTYLFKIALLGDSAVGKSSLRRNFMGKGFTTSHLTTLGADFSMKETEIETEDGTSSVKFQIWDLAGQKSFRQLRARFYKGMIGALVVYDITRPETFRSIPEWIQDLFKFNNRGKVPVIILGNKHDLKTEVEDTLDASKGQKYAEKLEKSMKDVGFSIPFFETSAKTGHHVHEAFHSLGRQIYNAMHEGKLKLTTEN